MEYVSRTFMSHLNVFTITSVVHSYATRRTSKCFHRMYYMITLPKCVRKYNYVPLYCSEYANQTLRLTDLVVT